MSYSRERIRELAKIAHIRLREDEEERMVEELNALRALAEHLQSAPNAEERDPYRTAASLSSLREDRVLASLPREDLLDGEHGRDGYFVVPRTVEETK